MRHPGSSVVKSRHASPLPPRQHSHRAARTFSRLLVAGLVAVGDAGPCGAGGAGDDASAVLDRFHLAASKAQFNDYFALFTPDAVFIGTDASERWSVEQFKAYAKPHFDKGRGWTYSKVERHVNVSADGRHASFDELLDNTALGRCRGTGVLRLVDGSGESSSIT